MLHSDFVHLHNHTQYSLLDGASLIPNLVNLARDFKMPALAITDHGNMFGAIEFYETCVNNGIKPIIGCEVYIAPDSRFEKTSHGIQEASFHLILLAKDETGYKNLMKLVSIGYLEGFYYRPRIDKEVLIKYSKGLVCLTSCIKGEIPHLILSGLVDQAYNLAGEFKETFGEENFYLELQNHNLPEQQIVNPVLIKMSKDLSIPVVATNDFHYLYKSHARAHEALLCIQTQTTLDDPNRLKFQTDEFYVKAPEEMKKLFSEIPSATKNTLKITEMCNLELDFTKTYLPHYMPPNGKSRDDYLKELVEEGLKRRYENIDQPLLQRVDYELKTIKTSGFTSYFLIAWDFVHYAKSEGIPVGPGRGSAAGSVVSYCLGITDIDPLKYDLLFERFLNPERVSLPDIDIDFCYERRNEVIDYVIQKYGKENVAQIITFGTMLAKAVIRDVARVMGFTYGEADRLAKLIPFDPNIKLSEAVENEPELRGLYKTDSRITQLIDTSYILEGLTRHASTHAAGVVISEDPLTNHIPLFMTSDDQITTGYPMSSLEKIGLLKMDFLGLRTLTVIDETVKIIRRTRSLDVRIDKIPLDDEKTYKMLSDAESIGVFQLESSGMRDLLKKLKPTDFSDLIALLALYRPGPIGSGMMDDYIKRKHGLIDVKYDHPLLEPILKDTYGIILYQEQVMRIANVLAGFSLSQADSLRRAISKKTPEVMEQQRKYFMEGALKNGIDRKTADKIFSLIEYFAGYGFNKSHSAAYAMISYRTAYLKANFPIEFMTALLTSELENTDKLVVYVEECERMGIKILPPDINESFSKFTMVGEAIRFGLAAVKNVGKAAVDSIVDARTQHGKFNSLYDFCERVNLRLVNRKVLESLIKCGAFDSFGLYRSQLMAILDNTLEQAAVTHKDKANGQLSFFDSFNLSKGFNMRPKEIPKIKEWPENQLLAFEKELLGFYITGHPLARYQKALKMYAKNSSADLVHLRDGDEVSVGGIIAKIKHTVTRKTNERMAIIILEDLGGTVEVLVFPVVFKQYGNNIKSDAIVFIKGKVNLREDQPKIMANEIIPFEEATLRYTTKVMINLYTTGLEEEILKNLYRLLKLYPGKVPVYLNFVDSENKTTSILVGKDLYVQPAQALIEDIEKLLGSGIVSFKV